MASQASVDALRSAIGNASLSALNVKFQLDGPQFVDGSRWVWSATGVANGGTVVPSAGAGFWNREFMDGAVNARWFGLKGDGTDESALILSVLQAARGQGWKLTFPAPASYYNVGNGVEVLGVGDNYTVDAHPGAVFRTANATAPWVLAFTNTGSNFTFSGGVLSWGVTPTARGGAAAIYVTGNQLINAVVENVRVLNSTNFGVYCRAMAGSGSHTVRISNIQASNTLGDGCHVENFDHSITMSDIQTENNGDDAVAVT